MPAPLSPVEESAAPADVVPVLGRTVRGILVVVAAGLMAVFAIAVWLKPYDEAGRPLRLETHLQLGLPPCTFRLVTGVPCPSCGMTTSFALLVRGDVVNSLRANAVGTLLAVFCLALIPWCLACAWWGRPFLVVALDRALTWVAIVFVTLLLARWFVVLGLIWWSRKS